MWDWPVTKPEKVKGNKLAGNQGRLLCPPSPPISEPFPVGEVLPIIICQLTSSQQRLSRSKLLSVTALPPKCTVSVGASICLRWKLTFHCKYCKSCVLRLSTPPRPTFAHLSVLLLAIVCCWYRLVKFVCFQLLLRTSF